MILITRSKEEACLYESKEPWVAISISTYKNAFPLLKDKNRIGLLQLCFRDEMVGPNIINTDHVKEILRFVELYKDQAQIMLIHCEMGLSRSPAVAAGVHYYLHRIICQDYFQHFKLNYKVFYTIKDYVDSKKYLI